MYKIIDLILKYTTGERLYWNDGRMLRSIWTGKYVSKVEKPVRFYTDFRAEESWGNN